MTIIRTAPQSRTEERLASQSREEAAKRQHPFWTSAEVLFGIFVISALSVAFNAIQLTLMQAPPVVTPKDLSTLIATGRAGRAQVTLRGVQVPMSCRDLKTVGSILAFTRVDTDLRRRLAFETAIACFGTQQDYAPPEDLTRAG